MPDLLSINPLKKQFAVFLKSFGILFFGIEALSFSADNEIARYKAQISKLPATYYSAAAYSFYTQKGITLPQQLSINEASKSFHAIIKLTAHGVNAKESLPILINSFYKAVHVTEVKNVRYNGEGSFEDWVYTYVAGEKNKFLLTSPFLDYSAMSLCENFIESTHEVTRVSGETVTIPTKDAVIISVTHTLYPAAYALSVMTGEQFGTDQSKWQEWWNINGATFNGPKFSSTAANVAVPVYGKLQSGQFFKDIVVHGKYQLFLTTGNVLTGTIEAKDDTSLILESVDGKAYTFRPTLVSRYEYLSPPTSDVKQSTVNDSLPFSFDELRGKQVGNRQIEVRVNSGMVFRGTLKNVNAEAMNLDVGGSAISISRDVTLNVRIIPTLPDKTERGGGASIKKNLPKEQDTVFVKNSKTNDRGMPGPDLIYAGVITTEKSDMIIIKTDSLGETTVMRDNIVRIVKNTANSYESAIKRYADPLFCPNDMVIVDIPPGKEGRPFFKVCIDKYEYPNTKGAAPKINVSYDEAYELCSKRGKRLCTADEWQWACSGIEGYTFPYGWNPETDKCNTDDSRPPEESGTRHNCVSKFGGYDMAGNAFEWVTNSKKQPSIMGGPLSKCQTITEGMGGSAKPQTGFRCCKSN